MQKFAANSSLDPKPPAIVFLQRRARVSEAHARLVAELYGLSLEGWEPAASVPSKHAAFLDRRARA